MVVLKRRDAISNLNTARTTLRPKLIKPLATPISLRYMVFELR